MYIVGVPIGHPDDITLRAIRIIRQSAIVVSESPAATQALLQYHGLSSTITSYGPRHLKEKVSVLIERLRQGTDVAFVSDCGSPVISDPGSLLIDAAHRRNIPVRSVPGPSAVTAAIAASGWSGDSFFFHGQLPEGSAGIKKWLAGALKQTTHSIAFCQPESLAVVLKTLAQIQTYRRIAVACDLTTSHEIILRGTPRRVLRLIQELNQPTAITIILKGRKLNTRRAADSHRRPSGQSVSSRRINTRKA